MHSRARISSLTARALLFPFALTLILILPTTGRAFTGDDQLEQVGSYTPDFFAELQDVELVGDRAYIFGVGGFGVIDVSDPSDPVLLDRYQPAGHPYNRFYRGAVAATHAYCGGREDLLSVIDISDESNIHISSVVGEDGMSYEGMALFDGHLYAARHADGLQVFSLADPSLPSETAAISSLQNAWDFARSGDHVFVADGGGGLAVLDISSPGAPLHLYSLPCSGAAVDVAVTGDLALLACGSAGVDVFDISDPLVAAWVGNYNSSGLAITIDVVGERMYVADWDDVEVVDLSYPESPSQIGWEKTPIRSMGLAAAGELVYVADWSKFRVYEFGPTGSGDVHLPLDRIDFGLVPVGSVTDTTFAVVNTGGAPLQVTNIESFNTHFTVEPPSNFVIPPGESRDVGLSFNHVHDGYDATFIKVYALDADESSLSFPVTGDNNPSYLDIGDPAPAFDLVDLQGQPHALDDYLGQIVLLGFFANW